MKSAQIYVKNACYNLKIALLLHKMTTANKSLIFLNSSVLVTLWCLTKRKLDKLQERPTVMDTEEMLTKLFQALHSLCQCFNSTCFQRLSYHLSCIQLYLRRWVHFFYLSSLFWLGIFVGLSRPTKWTAVNGSRTQVIKKKRKKVSNSSFREVKGQYFSSNFRIAQIPEGEILKGK